MSLSLPDLNNADVDVGFIAEFSNSESETAIDRLGRTRRTLAGVEAYISEHGILGDTLAAQAETELARDAAVAASNLRISVAAAQADGTIAVGEGYVAPVADGSLQAYRKDSGVASTAIGVPFASSAAIAAIRATTGKNLFDKSKAVAGSYYSPAGNAITASSAFRRSGYIPVEPGKTYRVSGSGTPTSTAIGWFSAAGNVGAISGSTNTGVAPAGANFAVVNITNTGQADLTFDATVQFEEGSVATSYESFRTLIPETLVKNLPEQLAEKLAHSDILELWSFNMIDPSAVDFTKRYSTGTHGFVTDALPIAASAFIPVVEGEWYTVSGAAIYALSSSPTNCQGGYFTEAGATTSVSNITFVAPVSGSGAAFQVPTGLGITHVVVSLDKVAGPALDGVAQMERGEMATVYQAYDAMDRIKAELLDPDSTPAPSGGFDAAAWFKYTAAEGLSEGHRFPLFRSHWIAKDKDLCVANTGTSLTARSTEHCTAHAQANTRPPLMHSNNAASLLWDKMRWEGQQYRRYDAAGFFTEAGGGWATANALAEWDDGAYRDGLTRYSGTTGVSVAFTVPVGAWQFNWIYRTDTTGVETNTVAVAEGNGKMQVLNGAGVWVEANGYVFTMREPAPVTRTVSVPNPSTDVFADIVIASKGNTTYQKRLKMRCVDKAVTKAVTITGGTAGRFMYWGVEWSPRQYMITYINAARGSHNTQATGATGLPRFQDNEIWSFLPDLLLFELPIHNDGAAAAGSYAAGYWGRLTNNFVFRADYELSLKTRGTFFALAPEMGMFTSSIAWNFGGIEDDGTLKFGAEVGTGKMMTALDKFSEASQWVWSNHPDVPCINAAARWCEAGLAIHGDLRTATEGSGKGGATFTNEGSHWNDTGSKIIAKAVMPLLDFGR